MPGKHNLIIIALCLVTMAAHAQTLTFEPAVQPPVLEGDTYAARLIEPIPGELEALLAREQRAGDVRKPMLRAMMNFRMIAGEMLAASERADRQAAPIYLHGMRMLHHRAVFDDLMSQCADDLTTLQRQSANDPESVSEADRAQAEAVFERITKFNHRVGQHLEVFRNVDLSATDAALREVFEPIDTVLSLMAIGPAVSHQLSNKAGDPDRGTPDPQRLAEQVAHLEFSDESRAHLAAMLDIVQRAIKQQRFVAQATQQLEDLDALIRMQAVVQDRKGIGAPLRKAYETRIEAAIARYAETSRREEARELVDQLRRCERTLRRSLGTEDLKTRRALLDGLESIDTTPAHWDHAVHAEGHARLNLLIDMLQAQVGDISRDELPTREDRIILRDLTIAYTDARRALLDNIVLLSDPMRSLSDPELSSLLSAVRDYQYAIDALVQSVAWRRVIRAEAPDMLTPFRNDWHALLRSTLDDAQRSTAMRDIHRQTQTCEANLNMPFEARLKRNEPDAQLLTGSLTADLLANLQRYRHQWLTAYVEGRDDRTATRRMDDVASLMRYLELSLQVETTELATHAQHNARWSMVDFDPQAVRYPLQNWSGRLKIACGALVQDDVTDIHRQVELLRRDAPLVELIHTLHSQHAEALQQMSDGVAGLVGQLRSTPVETDVAFKQRVALAEISRYTHEHYHAMLLRDTDKADAIIAYRNGLIEQVLPQLRNDN